MLRVGWRTAGTPDVRLGGFGVLETLPLEQAASKRAKDVATKGIRNLEIVWGMGAMMLLLISGCGIAWSRGAVNFRSLGQRLP